jgi:hypothetical protein
MIDGENEEAIALSNPRHRPLNLGQLEKKNGGEY